MTINPRDTEEIYTEVRDELTSRISKVTNFVTGSFNNAFLVSHSNQVREAEIKAKAAELAGYVDYAGKDLTEADLTRLGIDNVDPERINQYMKDDHLDRLAANYNVERDMGSQAQGTVTLEVSRDVTIQNGMKVGTQPGPDGSYETYLVAANGADDFDPDSTEPLSLTQGQNEVEVIAENVGTNYNVGPSTVTYLPNPQPSIQSVTNSSSIEGGEEVEENEELRSRVKTAVFDSAQGGTKFGIESTIENGTSSNVDVNIDEFLDQQPTFVDVVVDGGDDAELIDLIEESRPVGIKHNLARPNELFFSVFVELVGDNIDTELVESGISSEIADIGLGGSFSSSSLLNTIISSQDEIQSVPALNTYISAVSNESHVFDSTTNIYQINQAPFGRVSGEEHAVSSTQTTYDLFFDDVIDSSVTVQAVVDDQRVTLDPSTEYSVVDSDGDGNLDSIQLDTVSPDVGTVLRIDYNHNSYTIASVEAEDGTVFQQATDYGLIDDDGDGIVDSIDWSVGGSTPSDGQQFTIEYTTNRSFEGDKFADDRQLFDPDAIRVDT